MKELYIQYIYIRMQRKRFIHNAGRQMLVRRKRIEGKIVLQLSISFMAGRI